MDISPDMTMESAADGLRDPLTLAEPHMTVEAMASPQQTFSPHIDQLVTALAAAQLEIENPARNRTATVSTRKGYTYEFHYADLSQVIDCVRKPLAKHGLVLSQVVVGRRLTVSVMHTSGQWMKATVELRPDSDGAQAFASELTAYRRHLIQSLLSIAAQDDDDANVAEGNLYTPGKRDKNRWDDMPPPGEDVADPLMVEIGKVKDVASAVALLRLWGQHRQRLYQMRRVNPDRRMEIVGAFANALQEQLGNVIAAVWRGYLTATTRQHLDALRHKWDNEWDETLRRFRDAEPAAYGDLVQHANYCVENLKAEIRKEEEAAAKDLVTTPATPFVQVKESRPPSEMPPEPPPSFSAVLLDAQGEPAGEAHTHPEAWAKAFEDLARRTPAAQLEALVEHNRDTWGEVDADIGGSVILADVMTWIVNQQDGDSTDAAGDPPAIVAIEIPPGRSGPDLRAYEKAIEEAVQAITSADDMLTWEALNEPTYVATPTLNRMRILKLVASKKRALGIAPPQT